MQLSFEDRTYLVTGGGSGIGKAVAAALAAAGADVLIVGRGAERLAAVAAELGGSARLDGGEAKLGPPHKHGGSARLDGGEAKLGPPHELGVRHFAADVTDEDAVIAAVDAAVSKNGRLHGVVHAAGGSQTIGPITQIDSELWRRTVDLNVNGTMYVVKHAGRALVRGGGGSFVGISSIAASNTHRWFGAYGPTKSALDHLMQLAADELGASWVRFNSIRPGLTRTELVAPILDSPELSEDYRISTPLPRPGEVEDVANLALFLLSDAAGYITGQVINVDGGQMLRRGPDFTSMLEPAFGADGLRGVVGS